MAVLLRDIIANGLCVVNVKRSESESESEGARVQGVDLASASVDTLADPPLSVTSSPSRRCDAPPHGYRRASGTPRADRADWTSFALRRIEAILVGHVVRSVQRHLDV